jgi:RimJ/RimL family protein N-acetyltransferase
MMRLRDGTEATIRPIRADDKERMRSAFNGLDPQSVYTRVFSPKKDLTADELRRLTEVDPAKEVALVVTIGRGDAERIIAGGRYVASGDTAEIAFAVEEDFQRLGLASRLLRELAESARSMGIARFEAFVLPQNVSMLQVFRRSGLAMATKREDGIVRVTLELSCD